MANNNRVIVELGSVIQDRGDWNSLASDARLYLNNIVQYGNNAYRVKAVPVSGYLTKDILPTNTTYYTLFAGVGNVDNVPTANSNNVVKSGGVKSAIDAVAAKLPKAATAPASATSTGTKGDIIITEGYLYVCVNTNTWRRVAIETW